LKEDIIVIIEKEFGVKLEEGGKYYYQLQTVYVNNEVKIYLLSNKFKAFKKVLDKRLFNRDVKVKYLTSKKFIKLIKSLEKDSTKERLLIGSGLNKGNLS
jgi:hypothetical protein